MGGRLQYKPKPDNYMESFAVDMADIRGKKRVSTRGGLTDVGSFLQTTVETRFIVKSQHQPYYNTWPVDGLGKG